MTIDVPVWVRDAVFYQVLPDRLARSPRLQAPGELEPWDAPPTEYGFKGGDLYGVVEHLDRLRQLGITALYLNPVFASASNHRYHTDDYFHVDPLLGGDEALRELIDAAHARDMRIVLDGVFNHCGRGFWPFHHVLENSMQSPYRDWFHLHDDVRSGARSVQAYPTAAELERMASLRASGTPRGLASPVVLGYEAWWDLPALPKLYLDEPHVRAMMLDVAEHWLRFGIDGWRLDVAEEVEADFWREFRTRARSVNPEAYLVAEVWRPKPEWLQGDMFDAFMDYPLGTAAIGFAAQQRLDDRIDWPEEYEALLRPIDAQAFSARLTELLALTDPAVNAAQLSLLGSHDTPRVLTLCSGDVDAVRLAMLLQMTLPGAPCVYYGDEIGMEGAMDPDCRRSFPADPRKWREPPYEWLADLIALRHSSRALRDGQLDVRFAEGLTLAYLRRLGDDAFLVIANAADEPASLSLDAPWPVGPVEALPLRAPRPAPRAEADGGRVRLEIAGRHGAVLRLGRPA